MTAELILIFRQREALFFRKLLVDRKSERKIFLKQGFRMKLSQSSVSGLKGSKRTFDADEEHRKSSISTAVKKEAPKSIYADKRYYKYGSY